MKRETLYYDYVYMVHGFLREAECRRYVDLAEASGFVDAPITTAAGAVMRKDVRNNSRVMLDAPEISLELWERAKAWVVSPWRDRIAVGLNERLRFYRYEAGETFAPHYDGAFRREDGERSEFTFLIYLNDDFVGGSTRFFEPERFEVRPRTGSLLIFHHPQLHEGVVIESGTKYVLRSDVMYGAPASEAHN